MCKLLDTGSFELIYRSMVSLSGILQSNIHLYAIERSINSDLDSSGKYYDEEGHFFRWMQNNEFNTKGVEIKYITLFHFARRLETIDELQGMSFKNLGAIVTSENKITNFLEENGVTFLVQDDCISCFYNGQLLDFTGNRARLNKDRCINGYLLGEYILNEDDISGIKDCPEFIKDIEGIINEKILSEGLGINLVRNYQKRSKAFIFKIKVPINELIFDECSYEMECNIEYNTEELYNCIGSYIVNQILKKPVCNKAIRLKDSANVRAEDVLEIWEVSDEELYKY